MVGVLLDGLPGGFVFWALCAYCLLLFYCVVLWLVLALSLLVLVFAMFLCYLLVIFVFGCCVCVWVFSICLLFGFRWIALDFGRCFDYAGLGGI